MFLSDCKERREYEIKSVKAGGKLYGRAWELGVKKGERVFLFKKYAYGGGVILLNGSFIALGKEALSAIEVAK